MKTVIIKNNVALSVHRKTISEMAIPDGALGIEVNDDTAVAPGFIWDEGVFTQPASEVEEDDEPYFVSKLTIISRLEALNKFGDAITALRANDLMYEKWSAVSELRSDDTNAIELLKAISCDPDEILAEE